MKTYELKVYDDNDLEIESYKQRTNEEFNKWKYFVAMPKLNITGKLVRSFINGKERLTR